jgi:hypothetical protein
LTRETARKHRPRFLRKLLTVPVLVLSFFVGALPAQASNTISTDKSQKPAGAGTGHKIR